MDRLVMFAVATTVLGLFTTGINASNATSPSPSPLRSRSPSPSPLRSRSPSRSPSPSPSPSPVPAEGVVCNKTSYTNVYPIDNYVKHVLEELGDEVSSSKDYATAIRFPAINKPIMSGQGVCTRSMSEADCSNCIKEGARKVLAGCPHKVGARFNATGCKLWYDVYQDVV